MSDIHESLCPTKCRGEDVNSVIHLLHTSHSVGFVIQKASLDTGCSEDGAKQERVARRAS